MSKIAFLFCSDYCNNSQPDPDYAEEYACAVTNGFQVYLFNLDAFIETKKLKIDEAKQQTTMIYRGWMLSVDQYEALYNALLKKGYSLINTPEQYQHSHWLPSWYNLIDKYTAESVWSDGIPDEHVLNQLLAKFDSKPLIVKDYVKSRKHEWEDACYIQNSSDRHKALEVINTFITRQEDALVGGVVLREFLPLKMIGIHEKSTMPIANEVRVFCLNQRPFAYINYWSGTKDSNVGEYQFLVDKCLKLDSNFFTIDVAETSKGDWVIIEIGDGQVSGLQDYDPKLFYEALVTCLA